MLRSYKLATRISPDQTKELIGKVVDLLESYKLGIDKDTGNIVDLQEKKIIRINHVRCLLRNDLRKLKLTDDYPVTEEDLMFLVDETLSGIFQVHKSLDLKETEMDIDGYLPS
jgi:hypothetical protein